MAKTKKQQEDYAAELQKSFDRWEYLRVNGGSDPFWSDGCNMNLVHNHILYYKGKIEESMTPEQYPEIYYRKTPQEVDRDYMARPEEIRANAKKSLEIYKENPDYQFLCRRVPRLTERQKKDTYIGNVIGYVSGLETAINKGDLITMRRHERADGYINSFSDCAARVRNIKPPENEQMSLFVDYSGEDDDWDERENSEDAEDEEWEDEDAEDDEWEEEDAEDNEWEEEY